MKEKMYENLIRGWVLDVESPVDGRMHIPSASACHKKAGLILWSSNIKVNLSVSLFNPDSDEYNQ